MVKVLDSAICDTGSMTYGLKPQEILPSFQSLRLHTFKNIFLKRKVLKRNWQNYLHALTQQKSILFKRFHFYFQLCGCVYFSMWVCGHECRWLWRPEEGVL